MYSLRNILIRRFFPPVCLFGAITLGLIGCGKEEVRVYNAPKEQVAKPTAGSAAASSEQPHIHWSVPEGWVEKPAGGMRVGSFSIPGSEGQQVDVSVIPASGSDLDNVNRWRGQIGLEAIDSNALGSLAEKVPIGEAEGLLVDMGGADPQTKKPTRILGAILPFKGTTWFFKAVGDDALVTRQKPAFKQFLKSVTFDSPSAHHQETSIAPPAKNAEPAGTASTPSNKPAWEVPAGWAAQPPGSMVLARFSVTDPQLGKADVTVTSFPGDVGGLLGNVNRWRNQLGLPPVDQGDLTKVTAPLDVNGIKATLVEIENVKTGAGEPSSRLVVAVVPRAGQTWFFKIMGDDRLVAREKAALIKFVQSVRYPNA